MITNNLEFGLREGNININISPIQTAVVLIVVLGMYWAGFQISNSKRPIIRSYYTEYSSIVYNTCIIYLVYIMYISYNIRSKIQVPYILLYIANLQHLLGVPYY